MRVRVYQPAGDQPCRIVCPAPALRVTDQPEEAFLARVAALAEQHDPSLAGLPSADLDAATLPPDREQRAAWRLVDGAVVIRPEEGV